MYFSLNTKWNKIIVILKNLSPVGKSSNLNPSFTKNYRESFEIYIKVKYLIAEMKR